MKRDLVDIDGLLESVFYRLPSVFPEFGWKPRSGGGWVATSRAHTKSLAAARPDRIVSLKPGGFFIFGMGGTHWMAYLNGGTFPQGEGWKSVVDELAARVGRDGPTALAVARVERRVDSGVLERLSQGAVVLSKLYPGRALRVLRERRISDETISARGLGYCSSVDEWLQASRVSRAEVDQVPGWPEKSGVWNERIIGPWRRSDGVISALFGRALATGPKYMVCGARPMLYGHDRWAKNAPEIVHIVEGLLNVSELESAGLKNVAALGGNAFSIEVQKTLARAGVKKALVALDADRGGSEGVDLLQRQLQVVGGPLEIEFVSVGRGNPTFLDFVGESRKVPTF
jgi:DNA primase